MSQPIWSKVYSTDTEALFVDTTGVYPPELEHADELESEDGEDSTWYLYRFPLDRCKVVHGEVSGKGYLVPYTYDAATYPHPLPQYEEWFAKDLAGVASYVGSTRDDLVSALCCEDPATRAEAYSAIGSYHGFLNLDGYPLTLTEAEFDKRW